MRRLVVRAGLRAPFLGNPVTLDGLLAALLFQHTGSVEQAHTTIPLRATDGLWHGSSAFFEDGQPYSVTLTAALHAYHDIDPDLVARSPRTGRLPALSEKRRREYGNVQSPRNGVAARAVWWYGEGDIRRIEELFSGVRFVGKKNTMGYGEIAELDIEPIDGVDGLLDPRRWPLRPIPAHLYVGDPQAIQAEAAWRPAYWKVEHRDRCFVPETHLLPRATLEGWL